MNPLSYLLKMSIKHLGLVNIVIFSIAFQHFTNCYEDGMEMIGVFPSKKHSLLRPFQGNGMSISNWNFYGSTIVTKDFIRLTADKPGKRGGIWNTVPLESPYWEIHVLFRIYGSSKAFSGDGMAFWYTTTPIREGEAFGGPSIFNGISIMLDTYGNTLHKHTYPYISVMVNNGTLVYDHDRDGAGVSYAGCEATKIRSPAYSSSSSTMETVLLIRYDREDLIVKTDLEGKNQWNDCLTLSGVKLPSHGFLGVSASTGDLSDNHDVLWMRVHELDDDTEQDNDEDGFHNDRKIVGSDPYAVNKRLFGERRRVRKDNAKQDRKSIVPHVAGNHFSNVMVGETNAHANSGRLSNLSIFIIIFFTMLAIVFLAAVAYLYYQNQQERNRKRFY